MAIEDIKKSVSILLMINFIIVQVFFSGCLQGTQNTQISVSANPDLAQRASFDCSGVKKEYEHKINGYEYKEAMNLLSECQKSCAAEKDFCSSERVTLKAAIRNFVDIQHSNAKKYKDRNPGIAYRAYTRIIDIGSVYPDKIQSVLQEANSELPILRKKMDEKIELLMKEGETALRENHLDKASDIVEEMVTIDRGNQQALFLSQKIGDKYIENQRLEIEKTLRKASEKPKDTVPKEKPSNELKKEIKSKPSEVPVKKTDTVKPKPKEEQIVPPVVRVEEVKESPLKEDVPKESLVKEEITKETALKKEIERESPSKEKPVQPSVVSETPQMQLESAKKMITNGDFKHAYDSLKKIKGGDKETMCSVYIYRGIAKASQINESAPDEKLKGGAMDEFATALGYVTDAKLPSEYKKYERLFAEVEKTR